jgi:ricin-type beta-trefoil lectin protein
VTGGSQGWVPIQQWTCNSSEQQRFSLNPVESGPIPTETFIEVDQVLHGSPGLVSVHGSLYAGPYSMANRVVHVEFDNAQVGGWSTVADLTVTVSGSGTYEYRDYGIQPGYYSIRARFAGNGEFSESKSGEHNRTIKRGYQFVNRNSGKCLSLSENKNVNGQRFLQWDCAPPSSNGQVFSFWEPEGSGWYQIRVNGTNRCVDVINVSTENGAGLHLWDCLGAGQTNQHWKREPIQGQAGWYGLMPRHTFRPDIPNYKCMDVFGAGTGNGTLVGQWDCHWGGNQQWDLRGVIDP